MQEDGSWFHERFLIIGQPDLVGGAYFHQPGSGLFHNLRNTKFPPISTICEREMTTRLRFASAASTSSMAAALLFTMMAASAPVIRFSNASLWNRREPRLPVSRSNSRFE